MLNNTDSFIYMYIHVAEPHFIYSFYDQAEKDRTKALEHELEGARAIIHQEAIREKEVLKHYKVNVHTHVLLG